MMDRFVITVDGLAGTGKTSLSKLLAARLGFVHLSTGMLYRAVGYLALKFKVPRGNDTELKQLVQSHSLQLILSHSDEVQLLVDGADIQGHLYSPVVSEATSEVAVHRPVREALVESQRRAFPERNLVAEGRDMGTVIFPDARIKFWISTDPEIKVRRRLEQILKKQPNLTQEERERISRDMAIEIHERDHRDQARGLAPTVKSSDMIEIDNSYLPIEEALNLMLSSVQSLYPDLVKHE
ncbi:MAG: (d)CMP kinase [Bdellovibrionales bacterium]|nr:(d)CMP kinase [Bdellovibrionales bacterium]